MLIEKFSNIRLVKNPKSSGGNPVSVRLRPSAFKLQKVVREISQPFLFFKLSEIFDFFL